MHFFFSLTGLEILNISHNLWLSDVIILARSGEGQTLVVVTVLLQVSFLRRAQQRAGGDQHAQQLVA